jgi:multidrug efflux pump
MTSESSLGTTYVILQFDLSRDIDGAARDVQAALNSARSLLPTGLPRNPTYRKYNPADAPIMILSMTSDSMTLGQMYDVASTVLAQKMSQIDGIGQVRIGGSSLPAVRVELDPPALNHNGISVEQVRKVIAANNANRPKGMLEYGDRNWQIRANDQTKTASDYLPLVVGYHQGAAVHLRDVAAVRNSVEDVRHAGLANGRPAVMLILSRQPGANIIETVDRVKAVLPHLRAAIPAAIDLNVVMDRTPVIRASLADVERTLVISTILVVLVVFAFLRNARAALVPSVTVPLSLLGTFAVMYLAGFTLDTLSLMALTIATGFVVDDAVVVLENVSRHIEQGMAPYKAAMQGAREVSFTVLAMSLSLVAVFVPILFMGGMVGRMFREFAVTLSAAILVSLVVSLTTTPMMCARLLKARTGEKHGLIYRFFERIFNGALHAYRVTLGWALRHSRIMLLILFGTIALNVYLYAVVPKGFFPLQDTGKLTGQVEADQDISFQAMRDKLAAFINIIRQDPAVATAVGFTGGERRNTGHMFVILKPLSERRISSQKVIARLRGKLAHEPGAKLYLQAVQDIRAGGRASAAQFQYTLQADSIDELRTWDVKVRQALSKLPQLVDVNSDRHDKGRQTTLVIDRDAASRLGLTQALIDQTLSDLFSQRQVSTIHDPLNQYHVVMEAAPRYLQSPETLKDVYIIAPSGAQVPLSAFSHFEPTNTELAINHQGQFAATTLSFNLPVGESLSVATQAVERTIARLDLPSSVHGSFQGTAKVFQRSLANEPYLILAALIAVYVVLGILYESYVHPVTILSTLPSAGVGAILALRMFNTEFSLIALIGVILLIGIVKKNAIMMIDFALEAERERHLTPREAIYEACLWRFRPIMMTTMAAMFGALPLAVGGGEGSEFRQPLGISIVGGLILSQLLTLYTTPVVYLYLDRFRLWCLRIFKPMRTERIPVTDQS